MRDSISDQDPSDGSFFCGERIYTLETLTYERLNAELKRDETTGMDDFETELIQPITSVD